jgi:hypothetical protein
VSFFESGNPDGRFSNAKKLSSGREIFSERMRVFLTWAAGRGSFGGSGILKSEIRTGDFWGRLSDNFFVTRRFFVKSLVEHFSREARILAELDVS